MPALSDEISSLPSISRFMCRPARHMCTVSDATRTAATSASTPSHNAWFVACDSRTPAPMLSSDRGDDAPVDRGDERASGPSSEGRRG